jgi:hypothetical protein
MLGNPLAQKKGKKGPLSLISFHQSKIPYKRRARAQQTKTNARKTMERAAAAALALTSAQSARRLQNGLSLSRFLRKVLPNVKESLLSGRSAPSAWRAWRITRAARIN